jgi:hypothetical protein
MSSHNGGDQLARGLVKADFPACEPGVSDEKWRQAFEDFDPVKYREAVHESKSSSGDPDVQETGVLGSDAGEVIPNAGN